MKSRIAVKILGYLELIFHSACLLTAIIYFSLLNSSKFLYPSWAKTQVAFAVAVCVTVSSVLNMIPVVLLIKATKLGNDMKVAYKEASIWAYFKVFQLVVALAANLFFGDVFLIVYIILLIGCPLCVVSYYISEIEAALQVGQFDLQE